MPEPRAGEILVKVSACGVCHTDLHVMKAEVAFPTPAVMGHEISGTVAALGPGVSGPAVGTQVVSAFIMPCGFCAPCGAGRDDLCDNFFAHEPAEGHALRRHDAAAARGRHRRSRCTRWPASPSTRSCRRPTSSRSPDGLPLEESAVLGCAIFTAYGAVRHGADLRGGERIAVVAAGGVGINIIQIAQAFGASQIIAVDVRDDKLEAARRLGATDVVNATHDRRHRARARADRRPRRRRRVRGARAAADVHAGVRDDPRRRPDGGCRHRARQDRPRRSRSRGWSAASCASSARTARGRAATCRRSSGSRRRASSGPRRW